MSHPESKKITCVNRTSLRRWSIKQFLFLLIFPLVIKKKQWNAFNVISLMVFVNLSICILKIIFTCIFYFQRDCLNSSLFWISFSVNLAAVAWLKYCRYGVKLYPIQSISQSVNLQPYTQSNLYTTILRFISGSIHIQCTYLQKNPRCWNIADTT